MSAPLQDNLPREELLLSAFLGMLRAPDGDFAAIDALGKASGDLESLKLIISGLRREPLCKSAFDNHIRLGEVDLEALALLPQNTLGYVYANYMMQNNLKPLQHKASSNDYEFLSAHLSETHDIWHIVTGCNTDILGEIQLESFYLYQLPASRFWLALITKNLLKTVLHDIERSTEYMNAIATGWMMAKQAKPLFGVDWKTMWQTPLDEIRANFNIQVT